MSDNPYGSYQDPMVRAGLEQYSGYKNSKQIAGSCIGKSQDCEEVKITIIVELPHSKETGWGAKGLSGHTAMAIENEFYDYGPDYDDNKVYSESKYQADLNKDGDMLDEVTANEIPDLGFKFAPGRPWWGEMINSKNPKNVTLTQVYNFISMDWRNTNIYGTVYKIEFYVKKKEAEKMHDWWENRYQHLQIYSVKPWTGEQCTTTTKHALIAGGIAVPSLTQTPEGILDDLKSIKSTSYQHHGEMATITIIKKEASDWNP